MSDKMHYVNSSMGFHFCRWPPVQQPLCISPPSARRRVPDYPTHGGRLGDERCTIFNHFNAIGLSALPTDSHRRNLEARPPAQTSRHHCNPSRDPCPYAPPQKCVQPCCSTSAPVLEADESARAALNPASDQAAALPARTRLSSANIPETSARPPGITNQPIAQSPAKATQPAASRTTAS